MLDIGAESSGRNRSTETTTVDKLGGEHLGRWVTFAPVRCEPVGGRLHEILVHESIIDEAIDTASLVLISDPAEHGNPGVWPVLRTAPVTVSR